MLSSAPENTVRMPRNDTRKPANWRARRRSPRNSTALPAISSGKIDHNTAAMPDGTTVSAAYNTP